MPCRSDYMDPTCREEQLQRTAKLLVYVLKSTGRAPDAKLVEAADNCYCSVDYVPQLCEEIRALGKEDFAATVYNARSKTSRDLADWWEEHEAADRSREREEKRQRDQAALAKDALAKLTKKEIAALKEFWHEQ